ncbi:MAG: hypothetical protein WD078_12500 [Woeseia sp.]
MAEHRMDDEDLRLHDMFRNDPIPDNGFSERVVRRVRRRLWMRRLLVPVATAAGGLVAVGPASQLLSWLLAQLGSLAAAPALISLNIESLAPGMLLLASILIAVRLIEE